MPILDKREIAFDAKAVISVIVSSPRSAQTLGLPSIAPSSVTFDPKAGTVHLAFGRDTARSVKLQAEQLGALLIAFCIRARIALPRHLAKHVRIDAAAAVLSFSEVHQDAPSPTAVEKSGAAELNRAMSWMDPPRTLQAKKWTGKPEERLAGVAQW